MIKASKVSGVEELLKHEKFRPAYETDNPTPTQTKPDRARIITKDTANGLHERSCIDIVIEKKIEGDFSPAVYIRPLNESIADLLAKRCVKEIKSFEKELVYTEVNERFVKNHWLKTSGMKMPLSKWFLITLRIPRAIQTTSKRLVEF